MSAYKKRDNVHGVEGEVKRKRNKTYLPRGKSVSASRDTNSKSLIVSQNSFLLCPDSDYGFF